MSEAHDNTSSQKSKFSTVEQVSSGGVAFRTSAAGVAIALISVGPKARWQLPKGIVDPGETPEVTAIREVREEAGIETALIEKIDTIAYWYVGNKGRELVRFHKFVHFYLLAYTSGETTNHDREVNEARWVLLPEAKKILSFKSEKQVLEQAEVMLKMKLGS